MFETDKKNVTLRGSLALTDPGPAPEVIPPPPPPEPETAPEPPAEALALVLGRYAAWTDRAEQARVLVDQLHHRRGVRLQLQGDGLVRTVLASGVEPLTGDEMAVLRWLRTAVVAELARLQNVPVPRSEDRPASAPAPGPAPEPRLTPTAPMAFSPLPPYAAAKPAPGAALTHVKAQLAAVDPARPEAVAALCRALGERYDDLTEFTQDYWRRQVAALLPEPRSAEMLACLILATERPEVPRAKKARNFSKGLKLLTNAPPGFAPDPPRPHRRE